MSTYAVVNDDKLCELKDIPQMEPGAPSPLILANEHTCAVAYYCRVEARSSGSSDESIAIVVFDAHIHYSGSPNDEAINGHPLYPRGLKWYAAYEVQNSSWMQSLEQMNRVHPRHSAELFRPLRHFMLTFHDSTFECVGRRYEVMQLDGSMSDALVQMKSKLRG